MKLIRKFKNRPLLMAIAAFTIFFSQPATASEFIKDRQSVIEFHPTNSVLAGQIQQMVGPATEHIYRTTGLKTDKIIFIKISRNSTDFINTTGVKSQSVQGIAISETNTVILNAENIFTRSRSDIEHLVEHEIAHIVLGNNISHNSGEKLPRWFNEGLAQWASSGASELFSASYQNSLQSAFLKENLLPFHSITHSFPAGQSDFILAYAQSLSLLQFLVNEYGAEYLKELLIQLKSENNFAAAFLKVYKIPFETVESNWKESKKNNTYTFDYFLATHINAIIDSLVGLTALLAFILVYFRNRIKKKRINELDDVLEN